VKKWHVVDLQKMEERYKVVTEDCLSCVGLVETCCLVCMVMQFAKGTKIVWEIIIGQNFLQDMEMVTFATAVKEEDFLGDVILHKLNR